MARRIVRIAVAGLAALALGTPASADHVRVGSGFLAESAVEWHGPRLFFRDSRGPIDFLAGSDVTPTLRQAPRGRPDVPRGRGNNNGRGKGKKEKTDGFFGAGPTVVLPDVTAPGASLAGAVGTSSSAGPTAATPEPATLLLLGAGVGGAMLHRARRRRVES